MAFKDYSTTPADNTALGDGTYIGPDMLRNKVRPALQQIAADGKDLADTVQDRIDLAKGDPGGDGSLIAKFTLIATQLGGTAINIPDEINLVQTVGYDATDVGSAVYVYDAAVDATYVTAHPRSSFLTLNGRGFRLSAEQQITPFMFGAVGDGSPGDATAFADARAYHQGLFSRGDYGSVPTSVTPNDWYWDYANSDGAGIVRLISSVPNTVNMAGGANVQGAGLIFTGDTAAQTPNSGLAETNMIRMAYTVNSGAGQKLQVHLINGTLICAHDVGASGNEGAFILGTMRATGPVAGGSNVAIGCWGGDLHVEKASGVADGEMVGLEVGMTKAPALGSAKNIGVDIYSDDRSGITATRAGTGLRIRGGRGWTNFLQITHTDGATDICKLDQNGSFTITAPAGDQVILFQTNQNNTTSTNEVIGRTSGGVNVQAVMQADKGGQVLLGAGSNHPLVLVINNTEVGRWTSSALNLAAGKVIQVNGVQVVAARDTGWAAMTGTPDKASAYATGTVTLAQLAGRVAQLQASLTSHGLIGA